LNPFFHTQTRSQYAVITGFVVTIMILIAIISFFYFQVIVTKTQEAFQLQFYSYQRAQDTRNALFSCYGSPIDPMKLTTNCSVSFVSSYTITRLDYYDCTPFNSTKKISDKRQLQELVYFVPITENDRVCLGSIILYMDDSDLGR
jgi:type IV secretory pathway VirB3-like protein